MTDHTQQTLPLSLGALAVRHAFAVAQVEAAQDEMRRAEEAIVRSRQTIEAQRVRIKEGEERAKDYWDAMEAQLAAAKAAEAA